MTQRLLTCREAERAISHDLDGLLDDLTRGTLYTHLGACGICERLARSQRAQQAALRALGAVSLPNALRSFDPGTRV